MRLILEGIDGVGKSTILKEIERTHRCKSDHLVKPPKSVTPHQWSDYFRKAYDELELISRSHISERVYGDLIRGKSLIDEWQNWLLNMQLRVRGFRIVFIERELELVKAQMAARDKPSDYDLWVLKNWDAMRKRYLECLPPDLTMFVDNNGELIDAVEKAVIAGSMPNYTNPVELRGIGSLTPRVILLGDEFTRRRWDIPHAKPFDFGEASKMVFRAVGHLVPVYITNTQYPDLGPVRSQFQLDAELRRFAGVPIVALGSEALMRLRRLGKEAVATVPHPQYWRRFKYATQDAWVDDLRRIADQHVGTP